VALWGKKVKRAGSYDFPTDTANFRQKFAEELRMSDRDDYGCFKILTLHLNFLKMGFLSFEWIQNFQQEDFMTIFQQHTVGAINTPLFPVMMLPLVLKYV